MVLMKCTDIFRGTFSCWGGSGSEEGVAWEDLSMETFITREENFHEAEFFLALFKKKTMKN